MLRGTSLLCKEARMMSSLTKSKAFPDLVRRQLERSTSARATLKASPAPLGVWDDFMASTPTPGYAAMREKVCISPRFFSHRSP